MFLMKPKSALQLTISLALLSALGACGGGGGDNAGSPVSASPTGPTTPGNPTPTNPGPSGPTTPTNPPPVDPTPPVNITLAQGYTQVRDTLTFTQRHWPDWNHAGTAPIDGVACAAVVRYHIHAMVSIYQDNQRLALPGNVGRNACNYQMHTHDGTGVVHIESDVQEDFTLGQFFAEWGQPLSAVAVAGLAGTPTFYVIDNGTITRFTGDPATLELKAHREILIVTGTPPAQVPRYDWNSSGL